MPLYARYTEYAYDPERRDEVFAFWRDPSTTRPQGQPGFREGFVFDSDEQPGVIRIFTVWEDEPSFTRYFQSPPHAGLNDELAELSVRNTVRDGLVGELVLEQHHPHVRIIRARLQPGADVDALRAFWQERGREVLEREARRARAYVDEEQGLFIVQVWWDSAAQADAFVASEAHRVEFEEPVSAWVTKLDRVEATPLDA